MEIRQIKELMAAMRRYKMKRLLFEEEGLKIELEQEGDESEHSLSGQELAFQHHQVMLAPPAMPMPAQAPLAAAQQPAAPVANAPAESAPAAAEESCEYITSPIVGTFYSSSSPENPPFIKAGDRVEKDTVVCIVEAMKVMNEVKAGISGVVKECLIEDAHPVEFGSKLFSIVPA